MIDPDRRRRETGDLIVALANDVPMGAFVVHGLDGIASLDRRAGRRRRSLGSRHQPPRAHDSRHRSHGNHGLAHHLLHLARCPSHVPLAGLPTNMDVFP